MVSSQRHSRWGSASVTKKNTLVLSICAAALPSKLADMLNLFSLLILPWQHTPRNQTGFTPPAVKALAWEESRANRVRPYFMLCHSPRIFCLTSPFSPPPLPLSRAWCGVAVAPCGPRLLCGLWGVALCSPSDRFRASMLHHYRIPPKGGCVIMKLPLVAKTVWIESCDLTD